MTSNEIPAHLAGGLLTRFWGHVDRSGSCWEWTAYRGPTGYGQFVINANLKMLAHRFIDAVMNGPHAPGQCTLHICDNPACVRPSHLFRGTQADNMADKKQKGRSAAGSQNPHSKLTEAQARVIHHRNRNGDSQSQLARDYEVSVTAIRLLLIGQNWKHIYKEVHND